jgi:hypothetical protein
MKKRSRETLPATLHQHDARDALEYARRRIAFFRDNPLKIWGEVQPFDAASGRRWLIEKLKMLFASDKTEWQMLIVDNARKGSDVAREALRELMNNYINHKKSMPLCLDVYNLDLINKKLGPVASGPKPVDGAFGDFEIALIVFEITQRFPLKPTRNRAAPRECACSIVAEAATMTERRVEQIWARWARLKEH